MELNWNQTEPDLSVKVNVCQIKLYIHDDDNHYENKDEADNADDEEEDKTVIDEDNYEIMI